MKEIFIPMKDHNIQLILEGKKTTTLRSDESAKRIGLKPEEIGYVYWEGKPFVVYCRGSQTVAQAGGSHAMWVSEGFNITGKPLFKFTEEWLGGKGQLWVYDITPLDEE